jgi:hypothetical protein
MLGYGGPMSDAAGSPGGTDPVESRLRDALARGDAVLSTVAPVLRHLLASDDSELFGDAVLARVRGMTSHVAQQLAASVGDEECLPKLTAVIIDRPGFLSHIHALVLEGRLAELLQMRLSVDPVLPPLLQALIASSNENTAALAMKFLAAQARFGQAQRRMRLPLSELPGDLRHSALLAMRGLAGMDGRDEAQAAAAEAGIRAGYDESRSRLGLASRLVTGMGAGAVAALSIPHAGAALFLSALAVTSGQDRDIVTLATSETQRARLAIALCASGLKPAAIEEQLLVLDPDAVLPDGLDRIGPDRAGALLAMAGA